MRCSGCKSIILWGGTERDGGKYCDTCLKAYQASKQATSHIRPTQGLIIEGVTKVAAIEGSAVKIIKKAGQLSAQREKSLPIKNIASVEVKRPGMAPGFIQFGIAGGRALDSSHKLTGGAFDAAGDENSVLFSSESSYEIALKMKDYIENYREAPVGTAEAATSPADEIRKLKALLDEGILTDEEFTAKKRQILGI